MPVQVILKKEASLQPRFRSLKAAESFVRSKGLKLEDYVFEYVYPEYRFKPSTGYAERHKEAARRYRKNSYVPKGTPCGRPRKKNEKK